MKTPTNAMNGTESTATEAHAVDAGTRSRLRLLFVAAVLTGASVLTDFLRPEETTVSGALALLGVCVVGFPIVKGVVTAIRSSGFAATQFYMDQYVLLALAACVATGRYLTGAVVAMVLVFGQILEERTTLGVEMALARLRQFSRVRARRLGGDGVEEAVDSTKLKVGDEVAVLPGETIPADGEIVEGHALIDQSRITGESVPVEAGPGLRVFAGTLNLNGVLRVRVTGAGDDTVMGRVRRIIEEAKSSEAPIISLAEDFARYYTPLILLIAASVFFFTQDVERAIAVLVVSIPCAFVLASPSAMVSAIAAGSRLGLLIKSVRHLETARRTDVVVFDKTGTLTEGRLRVDEVRVHDAALGEAAARRLAAALEARSNHPVARAVAACTGDDEIPEAADVREHTGLGVVGVVDGREVSVGRLNWLVEKGVTPALDAADFTRHSLVALAVDGRHVATFLLADTVRAEAAETLDRLRRLGISEFVMLTGDRRVVADHIAAETGLTSVRADCLPEDKVGCIRELRAAGKRVMVVGDGLNDAPALAEADLGVAMGALGSDVTVHTADAALMTHDLRRLADLLLLSGRTVGVINQNLLWGFGFIIAAIILSSIGWVSPVAAAFIHEFSAFFVIFNSARLLRFDGMPAAENLYPETRRSSHEPENPRPVIEPGHVPS